MSNIAWAAGLFEGEGCISTASTKKTNLMRLALSTTDKDVLDRFVDIVGGGHVRFYPETNPKRKDHWQWSVSGRAAEEVLRILAPYLGQRRRQRALELLQRRLAYIERQLAPRQCKACGEGFTPTTLTGRKVFCGRKSCYRTWFKKGGLRDAAAN